MCACVILRVCVLVSGDRPHEVYGVTPDLMRSITNDECVLSHPWTSHVAHMNASSSSSFVCATWLICAMCECLIVIVIYVWDVTHLCYVWLPHRCRHWYVRFDSFVQRMNASLSALFVCATWLICATTYECLIVVVIDTCDVTHSCNVWMLHRRRHWYARRDSYMQRMNASSSSSLICSTWLIRATYECLIVVVIHTYVQRITASSSSSSLIHMCRHSYIVVVIHDTLHICIYVCRHS